ncbi:TPA: omptin family outer membrane protease [Escherichia coli]|nr:omptin family outer membrane protease [Escherichia coli]
MRLHILTMALTAPLAFSSLASTSSPFFTPEKVSTDISLGTLSGKTKERVYNEVEGGRKVSQLDWKYSNAAIIKGTINWELMPQVSLGLSGWTTIDSRSGDMIDKDWLDANNPNTWTDESRHPRTHLNYANEFDLNIKGWVFNEPDRKLGVMAGYQESRYSFNSTGGTYIYSENGGFRNETGAFPDTERGIAYKQRFKIPYIGLISSWRYNDIEINGAFKYSGWVDASDNDEHYERGLTFRSRVNNQHYYAVTTNIGYYVTASAKVYVEGTWNRITNKKGNATVYDRNDNTTETFKNGAGIESYNMMAVAGLKYTF